MSEPEVIIRPIDWEKDAVRLAGDEVRELVYYLVLADSLEQAKEYLVMCRRI